MMSPALGRPRGPSKGLLEGRRPRGWGNRAAMPGSRPRSRSAACTRPSPVPLLPPLPPPRGRAPLPSVPAGQRLPAARPTVSLRLARHTRNLTPQSSACSVLRPPLPPPAQQLVLPWKPQPPQAPPHLHWPPSQPPL